MCSKKEMEEGKMAVKVGNSWVTEEAYAYAKAKQAEPKERKAMLSQLSEKFLDTDFSTNTEPFSGKGVNNIAISPNILKEMEQNPEKQLEYEALIYDCANLQKTLPGIYQKNGSKLEAFGFIIDSNGGLRAWGISKSTGSKEKNTFQCMLPRQDKKSWAVRIVPKKKDSLQSAAKNKRFGSRLDVRA